MTIEAVILFPLAILFLLAVVQAGCYYIASVHASAAAREGAREAAAEFSTIDSGVQAATDYLNTSTLNNPAITGQRTPVSATVTVTAEVISIVPGLPLSITRSATAPVERITP